MKKRRLGTLEVSAMGLGCMGMSEFYGPTDEAEALATIDRAGALGVTLLDTADAYGIGLNEELVGRAIRGRRADFVVATKFGLVRDRNNAQARGVSGRPDYVRAACEASLRRLGIETIDLYYQHRIDPTVPGFVAYSPLGRGFLTGQLRRFEDLAADDFRRQSPRFQGANFDRNLVLVDRLTAMARERGVTPAQLGLAWVLSRGDDVVPIPGTRRRARLEENAAAVDIPLAAADLAALDAVAPRGAAAGDRYAPVGMALVNQ